MQHDELYHDTRCRIVIELDIDQLEDAKDCVEAVIDGIKERVLESAAGVIDWEFEYGIGV